MKSANSVNGPFLAVMSFIAYNRAEGEVRVDVSNVDGRMLLRVSDTGIGLDPAAASHAFERFWRADPSRSARDGGTGLGLAISKAIADAHGGTIVVSSEPDKGTMFAVELPLEASAAHPVG